MNRKNIIVGIGSVLFGIFFFVSAFSIRQSQASSASPSLFPKVISALMVIMGLLLLLREFFGVNTEKHNANSITVKNGKHVLAFSAAMLAYAALLNVFGFLFCTFLYLTGMTFFLSERMEKKTAVHSLIYGVVFTALLYVMFERLFNATLPIGIVFGG